MNLNESELRTLCRVLTLRWADVTIIGECLDLLDQFGLLSLHLHTTTTNLQALLHTMDEVSLVSPLLS